MRINVNYGSYCRNTWLRQTGSTRNIRALLSTAALPQTEDQAHARPYDQIPGPKPWPIIGNYKLFIPKMRKYDFSNLITLHKQLLSEFGDIAKISGLAPRNDLVFIYNPEDIANVYRNEGIWPMRPSFQSLNYYRTKTRRDFFQGLGGILNDQGEAWHSSRTQANPVLMQTRVSQLYASRINNVAEDFVKRIPEWRDEKNEMPATFGNELQKWALESIALIALDTRLGCLEPNLRADSEPQQMIGAVHNMFNCLHKLELEEFLWKFYPTSTWKTFVATFDFFIDVSMKYINQAIEKMKEGGSLKEDAGVLERMLARDPNPKRAVIMALDMLAAGVDTTSHSVTNLLLQLSAFPEKQEKLYVELKKIMPHPDVPLTSEMLNQLPYLRACIRESMRLVPVATGNARTTTSEIVLSNYKIPKNVDIVMGNGVISRLEKHYPDAEKFVPERWLRQRDDTKVECPYPGFKPNPFVTLPFGHGARKCVGMRFANMEIEMVIAKLVRRFRWEFHYGEMNYKTSLILIPVDPQRFTVHLRS